MLSLVYGERRHQNEPQSDFYLNSNRYSMALPQIYMYVGNRLTQMNNSSASAFKTVVTDIGDEIWKVWQTKPNIFASIQMEAPHQTIKSPLGQCSIMK